MGILKKAGALAVAKKIYDEARKPHNQAKIKQAVQKVQVHDTGVVDAGDGRNLVAILAAKPNAIMEILAKIGQITGLDLIQPPGGTDGPPAIAPPAGSTRLASGPAHSAKEGGR